MKKFVSMLLILVMVCTLFSGCRVETQEENQEGSGYSFYYLDGEETKLLKESYSPEKETADYMIQDLITRLNDRVLEGKKINLLPQEVKINSYQLNESVLELEFNSKYSDISRAREILVRMGVVNTFLQIPGITAVKFFVGQEELMDSKGQPVGEMAEDTFVEFAGSDRESYRYDTLTLYFTDKTGTQLVEETRNLYYRRNIPKERVILEQLAKGPMVKGHYPVIPENTSILNISTADRVCYVKVDDTFLNYRLDVSAQVMVYSVANSLLAAGNADKVQILVDGKEDAALSEEISLYNFYSWNDALISVQEE